MKKVSWGIIGCGDVTEIKSGPAFKLVPHSELKAVMRRDGVKAADYAKRHNIAKWYTDATDLIHDPEVNAIYIATPPAFHEPYALQAFQAGKPIYVEKPMALDSAEAQRMTEAALNYSCKLSVAHYRREQPRFRKIRQLLQEQAIGDILSVDLQLQQAFRPGMQNSWRTKPSLSGGGLFHDLAPHQLDLMIYLFGFPLQVQGTTLNKANLYEADDYVSAQLLFDQHINFNGIWDFNARLEQEKDICEILGTKGSIRFAVFNEFCELRQGAEISSLEFAHLAHVQQPMIESVVKHFLDEGANPCPPEDGVEVMRIMDTICGRISDV
jgi:predicted dehydrogenase